MRVRDLLTKKSSTVITIDPDGDLATAARLLMRHDIGGLPVATRVGELVGILSERDLVRVLDEAPPALRDVSVRQAMRRPAPTCSGKDTLQKVMARMTQERLRHLVVLEDRRIAGVISVGDLVKHRLEELETEAGVLRDYVAARRAVI
jgi:CBS domain-containing protein